MPRNLFANTRLAFVSALAVMLFTFGCGPLKTSEPKPYIAQSVPPNVSELRWSNGRRLKSTDPVLAAAPPETDLTRALFDGLTDFDPIAQKAIPAIAEKWEPSNNWRTWRFYLRQEAVWTNGKPVTADDFVRSWHRFAEMGERSAFPELLLNLEKTGIAEVPRRDTNPVANRGPEKQNTPENLPNPELNAKSPLSTNPDAALGKAERLSVVAESDRILKVDLLYPDPDFPVLAAHPAFRPVYFPNAKFEPTEAAAAELVTNGAFRLEKLTEAEVSLVPFENYWDRAEVKLDRVRIRFDEAEKALDAYRSGEVDAVSNADLSPAAVKLLEPYNDFRRVTHAAVNFYEINAQKAPFTDRRVRLALAMAVERERLVEGEMQGTVRPAYEVLPFRSKIEFRINQDLPLAKSLLSEAGFPEGAGFPTIRLVTNRNELQLRVARAVARMWKQNLGVDTEIVVRDASEIDGIRKSGDYDLIRRGIVFAAPDETAALMTIFSDQLQKEELKQPEPVKSLPGTADRTRNAMIRPPEGDFTEREARFAEAIYAARLIPLYFPTSVSLVKPYVKGMEPNAFDIVILKNVEIDKISQPQ